MLHRASLIRGSALGALLLLAACGRGEDNLAAIDNELIGNGADPAVTRALEDQIMVDPNLNQQANPNSVRPPETPTEAQYPPADAGSGGGTVRVRSAAAESRAAMTPSASACGAPLDYGPAWADRLPAEFPAYPGGRVTEAAGNNHGECRMRVVTFTTGDPFNRVIEYYRSHASRAGFSAEQQVRDGDQVLGGTRGEAAYYVIVTPRERGSEVALIVNNGR